MIKIANRTDFITGLIIFAGALFFWRVMVPAYCQDALDVPTALRPTRMVNITCWIIMAGSAWLSIYSLFARTRSRSESTESDSHENMTFRQWLRVLGTAGIVLAYVFLIELVGFYIASILFMAVQMLFFGTRKWFLILANVCVVVFFIFIVFQVALNVFLPEGIFS